MSDAISTIFDITGDVVTLIQGNALFMVYAAAGVVSIAVGVVKKLIGYY